jgi:hypothetical protein
MEKGVLSQLTKLQSERLEWVLRNFGLYYWEEKKIRKGIYKIPTELYNRNLEEIIHSENGEIMGRALIEKLTSDFIEYLETVSRNISRYLDSQPDRVQYILIERWFNSEIWKYLYRLIPDIYKEYELEIWRIRFEYLDKSKQYDEKYMEGNIK